MTLDQPRDFAKAVGVGAIVAVLTGAVTAPLFKTGIAPMPQAPSQAFAETLLGPVADPVGLIFHLLYVTAVTTLILAFVGPRPSKWAIAGASAALWAIAVVVFFPIVGWGIFGAAVTPKIAVAALGPHVLYGVLFWAADRLLFRAPGSTDCTFGRA
ncbi:hypothetical protein CKO28_24780 [Rhodovibrio sodomensis]|uniref:DUF1440 domain-containing protein n=1 Tax=Rhodovibrio sodomensis TaxID=1088 RepID=A0ABS1DL12_9PROT|nr:hypothetical protein [Rhodovibrio sodomensis]MBK1671221.1 hypothetical protein [Rhodovibrio sodomensis]